MLRNVEETTYIKKKLGLNGNVSISFKNPGKDGILVTK